MKYKLDFYTQYHQFYICDKASLKKTDSNDFWTSDAHEDKLALGEGILGISVESYGHIRGELIILDKAPSVSDFSAYDHVVEGGIDIKDKVLQILDCPNMKSELEINLPPRRYRVRISSSNLQSVSEDEGDDYYKVEVWPDSTLDRIVIKRFKRG